MINNNENILKIQIEFSDHDIGMKGCIHLALHGMIGHTCSDWWHIVAEAGFESKVWAWHWGTSGGQHRAPFATPTCHHKQYTHLFLYPNTNPSLWCSHFPSPPVFLLASYVSSSPFLSSLSCPPIPHRDNRRCSHSICPSSQFWFCCACRFRQVLMHLWLKCHMYPS